MKKWLILFIFLFSAQVWSYTPVETPNVPTLPFTMDNGIKVFHLIAEPVKQELVKGVVFNCWGYNGSTPGPTIEAVEGDRVRILVTNNLPEPTTIHWHGILLPNGMDGVSGLNQPPILPGETFAYEFTLRQHGTYMYHPHYDEMMQMGLGLMGFFIIHPKEPEDPPIDRDFAIFLQEWSVPTGAATPNPITLDFNYFTFNGKIYPGSNPLVVRTGQRVRIRYGNLSMDSHPIHLHGYAFTVTANGGWRRPKSAQYLDSTINVPVGATVDIEFIADAPGDWALHCHKIHHTMSGMSHDIPNMIGVNFKGLELKLKKLLPTFMPMGTTGMGNMRKMYTQQHMATPPNFQPPEGAPGQFSEIDMSGMFTIVKVRDGITSFADPGWYKNPPGTVAGPWRITQPQQEKSP